MASLDHMTQQFAAALVKEHKANALFWVRNNINDPQYVLFLDSLLKYHLSYDPLVQFLTEIDNLDGYDGDEYAKESNI